MTLSEENYLKAIFHLSREYGNNVSTNAIAEQMETKASSVTDMIKKLSEKDLVLYKKYQGVQLTDNGRLCAARIIRKHRLWEVFLVEKLNFSWDEVHEVAEQLEHIKSEKLVEELDAFLDFPKTDPHGDPIPDKNGNIPFAAKELLGNCKSGEKGIFVGVKNSSSDFLQYLDKLKLALGNELIIESKEPFDGSLQIKANGISISLSGKAAMNIYVQKK